MVVVFDSDVLIPMILGASKSKYLADRLRSAGHGIASSPEIQAEVADKLRSKPGLRKWLDHTDDEIEDYIDTLPDDLLMVGGDVVAPGSVPADPDDEKVIAAAIESMADYIVSEDRHLRDLGDFNGIPILSRDEMLAELDRLDEAAPHGTEPPDTDAEE
jgi:putative PIN family toxin of toxin-antitoxin system